MKVYRGITKSKNYFGKPKFGKGIYVTLEKDKAKEYAGKDGEIISMDIQPKNVYEIPQFKGTGQYILWNMKINQEFGDVIKWSEEIKSQGYDMIKGYNPYMKYWEYVILDPSIIKNQEKVDRVSQIIQEEIQRFFEGYVYHDDIMNKLEKTQVGTTILIRDKNGQRVVYYAGMNNGRPMAYKTPAMGKAARNDNYMRLFPRWIQKIGREKVESRVDFKDRIDALQQIEREKQADIYKQAYAHDKKYPNIDESEEVEFKKLEKTGEKTWSGGDVYKMSVKDDEFIHFTSMPNVEKILTSKQLNSGGNQFSSFAISTTFGEFVPGVQTDREGYTEAIIFTTDEMPTGQNYAEEVTWKGGVKFKTAKHISFDEAVNMLKNTPERLPNPDDDSVIYKHN